jgi:hypothetical protein
MARTSQKKKMRVTKPKQEDPCPSAENAAHEHVDPLATWTQADLDRMSPENRNAVEQKEQELDAIEADALSDRVLFPEIGSMGHLTGSCLQGSVTALYDQSDTEESKETTCMVICCIPAGNMSEAIKFCDLSDGQCSVIVKGKAEELLSRGRNLNIVFSDNSASVTSDRGAGTHKKKLKTIGWLRGH